MLAVSKDSSLRKCRVLLLTVGAAGPACCTDSVSTCKTCLGGNVTGLLSAGTSRARGVESGLGSVRLVPLQCPGCVGLSYLGGRFTAPVAPKS